MRLKIVSSLLIVGSGLGCYVQPYNPPPAQYGQVQPQPGAAATAVAAPAPVQPPAARVRAAARVRPAAGRHRQPPVAQPAPLPAPPPSQPIHTAARFTTTSRSTSWAATFRRSTSSITTSRLTAAGTTTRPTAGCSRRRRLPTFPTRTATGRTRTTATRGCRPIRLAGPPITMAAGCGPTAGCGVPTRPGARPGCNGARVTATSAGRPPVTPMTPTFPTTRGDSSVPPTCSRPTFRRFYVTANVGALPARRHPRPALLAPRQPDLGRWSRRRLAAPLPGAAAA